MAVSKQLEKKLKEVADFFGSVKKKDLEAVLEDLLTPKEISDLAERIEILRLLEEGHPQREIAQKLGISITTVNRGSRVLKWWSGVISKYIVTKAKKAKK